MINNRIQKPFNSISLKLIISEVINDKSKYSHEEIADWCDQMFCYYMDRDCTEELDNAVSIAGSIDTEWGIYSATNHSITELHNLELPKEWFVGWLNTLTEKKQD